ncbi:MAG: hypothetical protein ACE5FU_08095 [Nitrospinota bacterium]
MAGFKLKKRTFSPNAPLLFCAGINLTLLNFLMVQHISVALRQTEMAVLIFTLSFFSGISLGYILSDRVTSCHLERLMPAFLTLQMAALLFLQPLSYLLTRTIRETFHSLPYTFAEAGTYFCLYVLLTIGVTSFYAVFLPKIINTEGKSVRHCYSVEISGSLFALLLIPFLSRLPHTFFLAVYFLVFLAIASLLNISVVRFYGMAALICFFLFRFDTWDKQTSAWFYKRWYKRSGVEKVLYTRYSPYHKIEVAGLSKDRKMLLLNGKRQFSRGSHYTYSYFVAEYPARLLDSPKVLLLGCGSMSTVGRIGDFVPTIKIVDLDENVFSTSKRFFQKYNRLDELSNWTFKADDAKHFLAANDEKFDLIMHDIPPARSRQTALTYTREFFSLVKGDLTDRGIFSISSLSPFKSQYSKRMMATLTTVFDDYFILKLGRSIYFYGGRGSHPSKFTEDFLKKAVRHRKKNRVQVYLKEAVDKMVEGAEIISVNNVGDLIFAK